MIMPPVHILMMKQQVRKAFILVEGPIQRGKETGTATDDASAETRRGCPPCQASHACAGRCFNLFEAQYLLWLIQRRKPAMGRSGQGKLAAVAEWQTERLIVKRRGKLSSLTSLLYLTLASCYTPMFYVASCSLPLNSQPFVSISTYSSY